jgi:GTP-binding protein HflX
LRRWTLPAAACASRRIEVIVTDTVGFIRDLPKELVGAFRTTLEELREADLLLHVVDASAPDIDVQMKAVLDILEELTLDKIPQVLIFNKCDRLPAAQAEALCRRYNAIGICALDASTLRPLIDHLATRVHTMTSTQEPDILPQPAPDTALASPI